MANQLMRILFTNLKLPCPPSLPTSSDRELAYVCLSVSDFSACSVRSNNIPLSDLSVFAMESLPSIVTRQNVELLHFVLIPLMAPGHLLPMVDMARLLARRNVKVTLVTTPLNAVRVKATIERENQHCSSSSPIELQLFQFPSAEAGVPEGCESVDALTSMDVKMKFFKALCKLQRPLEELFETLTSPPPTCIISDRYVPSVASVAKKFQVPRIIFDGTNCFNLLCSHSLCSSKVYEKVSDSEAFVVPGLPHRIVLKKPQLPRTFNLRKHQEIGDFIDEVRKTEKEAYGVVVNSFQELEADYMKEYEKVTKQKIWCIGPVSLCNKDNLDKAQRGKNTESNNEKQSQQYLKWLDSWPARSVIYVCLGSLNCVPPEQLMELGLGLEASKRPFILVLRGAYKRDEMEKLLKEDGLEERVKARGLIIRGWVPQVLILSHKAIGSFLTHCGWNSTLEGICSGVPLITFPLNAEQFFNEKVAVQLLETGVKVGAETAINFGEEDKYGVQVKREKVKEAIEKVMDEDEESERIRERARNYAEKAKKAMQKGGSSWLNMSLLTEDIAQHVMGLKLNQPQPSPNA
ncbi:UDP-glycosyltransferase 73C4-like [Neltuma alba]|uniref:UDP-glycosyltransferase 73C4-like n=1 Tax=Neltuma alba TaxID=207710 RepID=UPI0010A4106B|nr:UDP-glycosyltransferase 73C4-like [Prosopis alba]